MDGASQYEKPNPSEGPNISKVAYDYNQNQWYTPLLKRNNLPPDLGTLLYFRRELLFLLHSKKFFPLRSIPPLQRKGGAKIPPPLHSFSHLLVFNNAMQMW